MRKYYISFVDISEVAMVTADPVRLQEANTRLVALGVLTPKGNPSPSHISSLVKETVPLLVDKMQRRGFIRYGGLPEVRQTMRKLLDNQEYTALFFYLTILYGYLQWQVPERISLLPAAPDALKVFANDLVKILEETLRDKELAAEEDINHETEK